METIITVLIAIIGGLMYWAYKVREMKARALKAEIELKEARKQESLEKEATELVNIVKNYIDIKSKAGGPDRVYISSDMFEAEQEVFKRSVERLSGIVHQDIFGYYFLRSQNFEFPQGGDTNATTKLS